MTKSLILYTKDGDIVATLHPADETNYGLVKQEIPEGKIPLIVDLQPRKVITVDENMSSYKKTQTLDMYEEKNRNYLNSLELQQVKVENEDLNSEVKESIKRLESSNAEILDFMMTE